MKPNLFDFATKELSQDAFLSWFLQWADPSCATTNESLHKAARQFAIELLSLQSTPPMAINRVKVVRQWGNIDIWVEVNDSHLVIIEDKVGTGQHSGQLARYHAIGQEWCRERNCELVCVYLKTQSDSARRLKQIEQEKFAFYSRRKLLAFLEAIEAQSDIYTDFRDRLRNWENSESGFAEKPIGEWDGNDWKGLYQAIEERRPIEDWGYVNNPAGGFWNLVLNWFDHNGIFPYMQIEQGNLCFKVGEVHHQRRDIREAYHRLLMGSAPAEMELERPGRFGSGAYMTVAIVPKRVWLGCDDEVVNISSVLGRLAAYESWLRDALDLDIAEGHANV